MKFLYCTLSVYTLTLFITSSTLIKPLRDYLVLMTPSWRRPLGVYVEDSEVYTHPMECRFCTGGWIALAVSLTFMDVMMWFPLWGASYFMATQER